MTAKDEFYVGSSPQAHIAANLYRCILYVVRERHGERDGNRSYFYCLAENIQSAVELALTELDEMMEVESSIREDASKVIAVKQLSMSLSMNEHIKQVLLQPISDQ